MLEPLPTLHPPRRPPDRLARNLPASVALDCLRAGWRDFRSNPGSSLAYGLILFAISVTVIWALHLSGLLYLALPALSGFLIVGPFLAIGLYRKSKALSEGQAPSLSAMIFFRPAAGAQLAYAGLMLCLLLLFWLRMADLLYALFFGMIPFPGAAEALVNTLTTPRGWALLLTGSVIGGLFAGFAFAISVFSVPMLVFERRDALTAIGLSFALTMRNLPPVLAWGAIVTIGLAISGLTGLVALIVVFPVLGHGTWHLFRKLSPPEAA